MSMSIIILILLAYALYDITNFAYIISNLCTVHDNI